MNKFDYSSLSIPSPLHFLNLLLFLPMYFFLLILLLSVLFVSLRNHFFFPFICSFPLSFSTVCFSLDFCLSFIANYVSRGIGRSAFETWENCGRSAQAAHSWKARKRRLSAAAETAGSILVTWIVILIEYSLLPFDIVGKYTGRIRI